MDKENMTVDVMLDAAAYSRVPAGKRTRSKSIGPGGLAGALKEDAGNRRKSVAAVPKSILKPSIPLSPLREIPSRKQNSGEQTSPLRSARSPRTPTTPNSQAGLGSAEKPQRSPAKSPLARKSASATRATASPEIDRAELERRQKERAERRKTLASRRVSFAPEATLHTWDVVEYIQESTTSSASTNSTRRASAIASSPHPAHSGKHGVDPSLVDGEDTVPESPISQTNSRQRKATRRSSGIPPMNFNNPDDMVSSSPYSGSSVGEDETVTSAVDFSESESDNGDEEQGSPTSEDVTTGSIGSAMSISSDSARLDAALRQATEQAHTRPIDTANDDDMSMDIAGDEITSSFKPWVDQNAALSTVQEAGEEEMSMDMTRAVGGILNDTRSTGKNSRKSVGGRRQSMRDRRRSSGIHSQLGEGTMEFTTAVGGIQQGNETQVSAANTEDNEGLSMEFTTVFGGIKPNSRRRSSRAGHGAVIGDPVTQQLLHEERRASFGPADDAGDMEMTTALGRILPQPLGENDTAQMDMTTAVGAILSNANFNNSPSCKQHDASIPSPLRSTFASRARSITSTSETGSPTVSNSRSARNSFTSAPVPSCTSPMQKKPNTPPKQITPKAARPITPEKSTPLASVGMRSASPKRLFQEELKAARSPAAISPFRRGSNGRMPTVVLEPPVLGHRRHSMTLSHAELTASPKAAALLDRRASIGDAAKAFAPVVIGAGVRFDDPKQMDEEITREHEAEQRRESGRFIMEREADDGDVTANLKGLIGSMTPKKAGVKGRKSLAVGGARGLLGKRPLELDEPDEDEDQTPKKLRKHDQSPVKKIRLPAPPPTAATLGKTHLLRADMPHTPHLATPGRIANATTPASQGRFKDAEALPSAQKPIPSMGQTSNDRLQEELAQDAEPIHLQDFLNMTNIRFMELNTTKRRHTVAPTKASTVEDEGSEVDPRATFEAATVAGSCTVPMLGLFQHSCRELKKYISAGRDIVREIENYTYAENPPVFQEYLSSKPKKRTAMENQFKNIKSHARLLSKEMWYEWRMKLLEGITQDLRGVQHNLEADDKALSKQEMLLESASHAFAERDQLAEEHSSLAQRAQELAESDPAELQEARRRLAELNAHIEEQQQMVQEREEALEELSAAVEDATEAKSECISAIREAKRVREECRGWSAAEVRALREQVDDLADSTGWRIVSAAESTLTMTYLDEIAISFSPASMTSGLLDGRISLRYIGDVPATHSLEVKKVTPKPLTTEKRFFLQNLQAHVVGSQRESLLELMDFVSRSWDLAIAIAGEVELLNRQNITASVIAGDDRLVVETSLVLPMVESKAIVRVALLPHVDNDELVVSMRPSVEAVYGERYKEDKMAEFLQSKIGDEFDDNAARGVWAEAVRDLKSRLIARGKK